MSASDQTSRNRRDFLKLAGSAAPAAALAVASSGSEAEAAPAQDKGKMQDTAHTRAYYDSARF